MDFPCAASSCMLFTVPLPIMAAISCVDENNISHKSTALLGVGQIFYYCSPVNYNLLLTLAKYTKELDFESLQKTGAFLDDMQLETPDRKAPGKFPEGGQKSRLSVVRDQPEISEDHFSGDDLGEPVVRSESFSENLSEAFQPGKDDLLLSELQTEMFILFYSNAQSSSCGNVAESLKQVKNDKGQGLSGRYYKHANWILEQRGLKKVKRA